MESLTRSSAPENLKAEEERKPILLPLLPIRDVVLFPGMVLPVAIGREKSVRALEMAVEKYGRRLFLVTQKSPDVEDPGLEQLYRVGTVGEVVQVFKLPDNTVKTLIQGIARARILDAAPTPTEALQARLEMLSSIDLGDEILTQALGRQLKSSFESYVQLNSRLEAQVLQTIAQIQDVERLIDVIAANVSIKTSDKQELLETLSLQARAEKLLTHIVREIEILNLEKKIQVRVRSQVEKTQKEFFLNEQMKAIQKELKQHDDYNRELEELKAKVKEAKMTKEAEDAALKELGRLAKMTPYSPEATVVRTYLDWLVSLPWSVLSRDHLDLDRASKILDEDHYGLEKSKERILEYLAVCRLKGKLRGPILCFVGPPGVGKTSLARSVARVLGRAFVRISLGGVRDEAELRGHRRTYIGALPGRIIQQIRKAKTRNPVILLDEIDKMGTDWRGDPAAALLEVLDPEQNHSFVDHYLEAGFDLSDVFFITTANTTFSIPPSLVDRLEVLRFSGYTPKEKQEIARRYLTPKQISEHGLTKKLNLELSDEALGFIIDAYTQEAGVRNLDREIASICRKAAREFVTPPPPDRTSSKALLEAHPGGGGVKDKSKKALKIGQENVAQYLGVPKYKRGVLAQNGVGVTTGLAWTDHGGELLTIEVTSLPGKGAITLTGKLGEVMQESAQTAFSYVKSLGDELGFEAKKFQDRDFHLHVPEGAVPKDGPSAGVAMACALASLLSGRSVKPLVAMTGETTLRGRVLAIGGLKEKLVAAHRERVKTVIIPKDNESDLEEIPKEVKEQIHIVVVENVKEVLNAVLL